MLSTAQDIPNDLRGTVFLVSKFITFLPKVPDSVLSHAHSWIEEHEVLQDFGVLDLSRFT